MAWEIEYTNEFEDWWNSLTVNQQDDVTSSVRLLEERGAMLGFPHSSKILNARYSHLRELRTQSGGRPLRTLYAFNPLRNAILLLGGDKTGDDRWYDVNVPKAEQIYQQHLQELRKKKLH